ncbi:MAG: uncharacterized protein QOJ27_2645 [Sphingomonadales bacterium]|nr:uncharacterized protein [Sphingomonadales bacterium]
MTLKRRGLDFAEAERIFDRYVLTLEDRRFDYGGDRYVTYGMLNDELVACVWTLRAEARRIVSLRKAKKNEREIYRLNRP